MLVHSRSHTLGSARAVLYVRWPRRIVVAGRFLCFGSSVRRTWADMLFSAPPPSPRRYQGHSHGPITLVQQCDVDDMVCEIEKREVDVDLLSSRSTQNRRRSRAAFLPQPSEMHADKLHERELLPRDTMHSPGPQAMLSGSECGLYVEYCKL